MVKRLYVGGIPYSTSQEALRAHFEQAGKVESVIILMDKVTGRSKGFGFVEMADEAGAEKAISMFHNQPLEGRNLTVNEARPKEERPRN